MASRTEAVDGLGQRAAHGRRARRAEFADFHRAELPRVLVIALVLAGPQADDLAHEVMLTAYRRWRAVRELARPDAWAHRTCAELCTSRVRRRLATWRGAVGLRVRRAPRVDHTAARDPRWARVRDLPQRQAHAVALSEGLGLDLFALADALDVTPMDAAAYLDRAHHALGPPTSPVTGPSPAGSPDLATRDLEQAAAAVDVDAHFDDLVATRRRRAAGRVVVAFLLAATTTALVWRADDDLPAPDGPHGTGTIVSDLSGSADTGTVRLETTARVTVLRTLPDGRPLVNPVDLEVSPDGSMLALVGDDRLQVVGLGDDPTSTSVPCRQCLGVNWIGYRVGQLIVTSLRGSDRQEYVFDDNGRVEGRLMPRPGLVDTGYSPDYLRRVGVLRTSGRERLYVTDMETRSMLDDTAVRRNESIVKARWSPDGVRIGYVVRRPAERGLFTYTLNVVNANGEFVRTVAGLGTCACPPEDEPGFAWSPDGGRVIVGADETGEGTALATRVLALDGSTVVVVPGSAPVDWGPFTPRVEAGSRQDR